MVEEAEANIISAKGLTAGYGREPVIRGLTLGVRKGEVLAVLGMSGCGKTTLLRALTGLIPVQSGRIVIAEEEVTRDEDSLGRARRHFGFLFQTGALLNALTVAENVALPIAEFTRLPGQLIAEMVDIKLELVHLGGAAHMKPPELSGGMRKRAGLARAMALDPEVLFCDEPSAGLDPPTAREVDRLLQELNRHMGVTVVLVTHDLATIDNLSCRCVMLDREASGIIAEGTLAELKKSGDRRVSGFFSGRAIY